MDTQNYINNLYAFQIQSNLLALHLQLAEGDEKPKRSGDFESTYKNAAGNEVTIKRSPNGKFASKGGGGSSPSSEATVDQKQVPESDDSAKLAKNILNEKTGNQVKDSLVATTSDLEIKSGIRKASFSEILDGAGDAMSNASDYIGKKTETS